MASPSRERFYEECMPPVQCVPDQQERLKRRRAACALCRQPYCWPRMLPCRDLHTFCTYCLQYLAAVWPAVPDNDGGGGAALFCPECAEQILLPENGVEGFKENHYILDDSDSSDLREPQRRVLQCLVCSHGNAVRWACAKCGTLLCNHCRYFHDRFATTHCLHPVAPLRIDSCEFVHTNQVQNAELGSPESPIDGMPTLPGDYSQVRRDNVKVAEDPQQRPQTLHVSAHESAGHHTRQKPQANYQEIGRVVSEHILATQRWPADSTGSKASELIARAKSCPGDLHDKINYEDEQESIPTYGVSRSDDLAANLPLDRPQSTQVAEIRQVRPPFIRSRPLPMRPLNETSLEDTNDRSDSEDSEDYDQVAKDFEANRPVPNMDGSNHLHMVLPGRPATLELEPALELRCQLRQVGSPAQSPQTSNHFYSAVGRTLIADLLPQPVSTNIVWGNGNTATGLCVANSKFILYGHKTKKRKRSAYRVAIFDAIGTMVQKITAMSEITGLVLIDRNLLLLADGSSSSLKQTTVERMISSKPDLTALPELVHICLQNCVLSKPGPDQYAAGISHGLQAGTEPQYHVHKVLLDRSTRPYRLPVQQPGSLLAVDVSSDGRYIALLLRHAEDLTVEVFVKDNHNYVYASGYSFDAAGSLLAVDVSSDGRYIALLLRHAEDLNVQVFVKGDHNYVYASGLSFEGLWKDKQGSGDLCFCVSTAREVLLVADYARNSVFLLDHVTQCRIVGTAELDRKPVALTKGQGGRVWLLCHGISGTGQTESSLMYF